jgi:hypothetical protein
MRWSQLIKQGTGKGFPLIFAVGSALDVREDQPMYSTTESNNEYTSFLAGSRPYWPRNWTGWTNVSQDWRIRAARV